MCRKLAVEFAQDLSWENQMKKLLLFACLTALALSAQDKNPNKRMRNATASFSELMRTPDKAIPEELFGKSKCIIIVPDLKKGAFGVGGKYGRGYVSCRKSNGRWGSPAAVAIEGGSFGLQLGGSSTDVIMLVMNQSGMDRLLGDKFTIGGEASAALGPVGRQTSANTDALMRAEILSWSRSRGLFAGLSLEGATLRPDAGENRKLYGREISNKEIIQTGAAAPAVARPLLALLNGYFAGPVTSASLKETLSTSGSRVALRETEIRFDTGKSTIPSSAKGILSEVVTALKENPTWRVRVEGYTDNVGSKAENQRLSAQRAQAVVAWLTSHGIGANRLIARGYGEGRPVADNSSDEGRARNRRVELVRQ